MCAPDVVWEDMNEANPAIGPEAVGTLLRRKFPEGSSLSIERLADGAASSGFTFHRESESRAGEGLRGTLYAELSEAGQLVYVREGTEPLFKPGEATEAILKAVTKGASKPEVEPTYRRREPRSASDLVEYLWKEASPGGAQTDEVLRLFAEDIRYEDFNYPTPFLGKPAVAAFLNAFDIPGIEFVPLKISEGSRACCFTWLVKVNGEEGPQGISFYEIDASRKVSYIRDIPAPALKPPPLATLAALADPQLRLFRPRAAVDTE